MISVLVFGSPREVPALLSVPVLLGVAAAGALLFALLKNDFEPDSLFSGSPREAVLGPLAAAAYCVLSLRPALPAPVFGVWSWPPAAGGAAHAASLALLGALAFRWISGTRVRAPWRSAAAGAAAGLAAAGAGALAPNAFLIAWALRRIGFPLSSLAVCAAVPAMLLATVLVVSAAVLHGAAWGRLRSLAVLAALGLSWVLPISLAEAHLAESWGLGPASLAEAAGVPPASEAESVSVVVLSSPEGEPGVHRRESVLSAEGIDASRPSLWRVRDFLESRGYRTVFLRDALRALREGWLLNWEASEHLDAAMLRAGERFPPDFPAFVAAIRAAPATPENVERLALMSRRAESARFPTVKLAQGMYEGFSAAYARYGDLDRSNLWLEKIRGLWPLYDDDIHIEPVAENLDGRIEGSLLYGGRPARSIRVGLFVLPSTMTAIDAGSFLAGSALPDSEGAFAFDSLVPGRYYLALQADRVLLGDSDLVFRNAPGVIRLEVPEAMSPALLPIEIER